MADTPLFDQMSALLTYANGITGAGDTHLGDAVRSLADGYGGGGGGKAFVSFDFTLSADAVGSYTITHNFGKDSYVALVWCDSESTYGVPYAVHNLVGFVGSTFPVRIKTSATGYSTYNGAVCRRTSGGTTCSNSFVNVVTASTQNSMKFDLGNNIKLISGVTYHALVIEL